MATYILRDLPDDLWARVKARAEQQGWPLRPLIIQLISDFADGRTDPRAPSPMAEYAWMAPYFRDLVTTVPTFVDMPAPAQWTAVRGHILSTERDATIVLRATKLEQLDYGRRQAILKWLTTEATEKRPPNSPIAETPPRPRVAFFKLHDGDRIVRVPHVLHTDEGGGEVLVRDVHHRLVARFSLADVQSWWVEEDGEPPA